MAKFEPRDLLDILVPDIRTTSRATLAELAACLDALEAAMRNQSPTEEAQAADRLDALVDKVRRKAAEVTE